MTDKPYRPNVGAALFNAAGLVYALVVYAIVAVACIFAAAAYGLPSPLVLVLRVIVLALPLIAVTIAVYLTKAVLKLETPPLDLIIPAIYVFAVYLLIGTFLSFAGPIINLILLILIAVALFRQARVVANLSTVNSVAFALLTLVLLVALPASLYMLMAPGNGPT